MRRILAAAAVALAGVLVFAAPAQAEEPKLSATHAVECGEVTVTFTNNTAWQFWADVRVDNESGTDDDATALGTIQNGPNAGKEYGQRYQDVAVPAGGTITKEVTFAEDSGEHTVAYRIWRGPETDYYVDWQSVDVESNCQADPPPPAAPQDCEAYVYAGTKQTLCDRFPGERGKVNCDDVKFRVTLVDAANDPWGLDGNRGEKGVGCESNPLKPADNPPAAGADAGQSAGSLPVTGASVPVLGGVAAVLLVGGGAAVLLARRRRTRFSS